jgi:hypothetical protein
LKKALATLCEIHETVKKLLPVLLLLVAAFLTTDGWSQKKKKGNAPPPVPVVNTDSIAKVAADSIAKASADSIAKVSADSLAKLRADSIAKVEAEAKKDCYTKWYETVRSRGAKTVTDGMQDVVIALKSETECNCFVGQVEVAGGKIKPPLMVQQENGEYRSFNVVGKKIDAGFATAMGEDQLYAISEGMSIVFRTTDNEYGRLFFFKFVNKSAQSNKAAPNPADLIKD